MNRTYSIINLDSYIPEDAPLFEKMPLAGLPGVSYEKRFPSVSPACSNTFLLSDPYNEDLRVKYSLAASVSSPRSANGFLYFEQIWTAGNDGLLIDQDNGLIYVGSCVLWGVNYFRWWIENSGFEFLSWNGEESCTCSFGEHVLGPNNAYLFKQPGYNIYGHWLLDIVPRMAMVGAHDGSDYASSIFHRVDGWRSPFIDAFPIPSPMAYCSRLSLHKSACFPSACKKGYGLSFPINSLSWLRLGTHLLTKELEGSHYVLDYSRIYISRRNHVPGRGRTLANADEVERLVASLGFVVFHPQEYDLTTQARIYSMARVIIGEDGSALHSVVFAPPSCKLGVLSAPHRENLWHAAICNLMGHGIAYLQLHQEDSGLYANIDELRLFLDMLILG